MKRHPQRIVRLTPIDTVMRAIDTFSPVAATDVATRDALGAVLARDVRVDKPQPPTAVALRDGWALAARLTADASAYAPVPLSHAPVWIESGAALPPATDAVLAPDAVIVTANAHEAIEQAAPGDGVLPAGFDVVADEAMLRARRRLRAVDIVVLGAADVSTVTVRCPRVLVVPARRAHEGPAETFAKLIAAMGATVSVGAAWSSLARDDFDLCIVLGGTGQGGEDETIERLRATGEVICHGIALRPGETAALARLGSGPALALPGRFDAALATWLVVGEPLLARLAGETIGSAYERRPLGRKIVSTIGFAEPVLVRTAGENVEPLATGVFSASALAAATGWVLVPPESEGYASGMTVDVRPLA